MFRVGSGRGLDLKVPVATLGPMTTDSIMLPISLLLPSLYGFPLSCFPSISLSK